jgi:hypothetical protein
MRTEPECVWVSRDRRWGYERLVDEVAAFCMIASWFRAKAKVNAGVGHYLVTLTADPPFSGFREESRASHLTALLLYFCRWAFLMMFITELLIRYPCR